MPSPGAELIFNSPPGAPGSRSHSDDSQPAWLLGGDLDGRCRNAAPVIVNLETDLAVLAIEVDIDLSRLRMASDVGQGLLGDSKQMGFRLVGHAPVQVAVEFYAETGALLEPLAQPAQTRREPEIIQDRRPQEL